MSEDFWRYIAYLGFVLENSKGKLTGFVIAAKKQLFGEFA